MLDNSILIDEPLYPKEVMHPWEEALFQTSYLRRLKHLAHYGAGALVSPVVHSRFEHTLGVWRLTARYFPENDLIRVAAILHDIGHLPFSHALESALGFNHHQLTEAYICDPEITNILAEINILPQDVIDYLNGPSPLTGTAEVMGLDHLDSFLRDTYMAGQIKILPRKLLEKIRCNESGVVTDEETGCQLLELIYLDHQLFLSPLLMAADQLLIEAVKQELANSTKHGLALLTDAELLSILYRSDQKQVNQYVALLTRKPDQIKISHDLSAQGIPLKVRKLYQKTPLCMGQPLSKSEKAQPVMQALAALKRDYQLLVS